MTSISPVSIMTVFTFVIPLLEPAFSTNSAAGCLHYMDTCMTFEAVGPRPQNTLGHPADEVTLVVVFFPRMGGARRGADEDARPPEVHIARRPRTGLLSARPARSDAKK